MKAVIGEYGKVIILAVVLGMLVLFLFGRGNHGFLGMISKARPEAAVGNEDSFAMAQTVFSRKVPELSVSVRKLQKGREYNLLDSGLFEIRAVNPEGEEVPVTIVKLTAPGQQDITGKTDPRRFVPSISGEYQITYRAEESFQGSIRAKEKKYSVLVD